MTERITPQTILGKRARPEDIYKADKTPAKRQKIEEIAKEIFSPITPKRTVLRKPKAPKIERVIDGSINTQRQNLNIQNPLERALFGQQRTNIPNQGPLAQNLQ